MVGEDKVDSSGLLSPPSPPRLPHAKWPVGSTIRSIDLPFHMRHPVHSTRSQSTRERGSPPPRGCPNTRVAGGGGLGRMVMSAFVYPWAGKRKPNPTGAVCGCELGIETV